MPWPMSLYELALMTARRAYDMNVEVSITLVTPEDAPLASFGAPASEAVARLLAETTSSRWIDARGDPGDPRRISRDPDRGTHDAGRTHLRTPCPRRRGARLRSQEAAEAELVEAIRRAAAGDSYLNPRLGARVAATPPPGPPDGLSEREVDVLRLIALGHTNAEIAEGLYLSVRTVETHCSHIQQKLRLGSRSELVRYALDHGLVAT
jgi:DNA-binding CsgD family transcriptional regulator